MPELVGCGGEHAQKGNGNKLGCAKRKTRRKRRDPWTDATEEGLLTGSVVIRVSIAPMCKWRQKICTEIG